jgi:hypothetical protein
VRVEGFGLWAWTSLISKSVATNYDIKESLGLGRATDYRIKKLKKKNSISFSYSKDSNPKQGQGAVRVPGVPRGHPKP